MRARTGLVTPYRPSPEGPHVEQVGWGVARQVVGVLRESGGTGAVLEELPGAAERPGHLVYAVFLGRTAVAAAHVVLEEDAARYVGDVLLDAAPPGTREALVVRALHDVAQHGKTWLELPDQVEAAPFA